jgi:RHS repeat-associated protein
MDALSAEYSAADNSTGDRLETYWDQSAQTERVYYYRVSTISSIVGGLTESAMSGVAAGQALSYDPQVPPPPQGLRAWAAHTGNVNDQRGVHLNWCAVPTPVAGSAEAATFPAPTEYRVYRKQLISGLRYELVARFAPSCLVAGARCEVTAANDCSNNDPSTCNVLGPLTGACGGSGQPLCGILDRTFGCWPSTEKVGQSTYNYSYFVTSVAGASPGVESMPSNFNEAWLNYCSGANANDCVPVTSCAPRRDPDGDGQFLVCGDENALLWNDPKQVDFCAEPPREDFGAGLAPYRVIGQSPPSGNPPSRFVFYHLDHVGTPRLILDESGATVSQHHYLPFGEERPVPASPDPTLNRRALTGHERDTESGLDYMMARYYSSSMPRFISPDPLGGQLVDPQSLNKYTYARNNPLNLIDPTGLYTCKDSKDCSSDQDKAFEASRQRNLKSKDPNVSRAAGAYGEPGKDNGVNVGFADLSKAGEGGNTTSTLGEANGDLRANSEVTINSKATGTELDAAVGHEGSHVADAQDLVKSIKITDLATGAFTVGQDITQYASEKRAYQVTDSIFRSANASFRRGCGVGGECILGAGIIPGKVTSEINRLLAYPGNNYKSSTNGQPLSPTNEGGSIVPH